MHQGSCLCGSIRYTIDGELSDFGYCHCRSCRKASGSAFGANAAVERSRCHVQDPQGVLRTYESSAGKLRAFCGRCGSPVYAYVQASPDILRLRLGLLDTPFDRHAKAHGFVADKADWEVIEDGLPQFDAWPDPAVLRQPGSHQAES